MSQFLYLLTEHETWKTCFVAHKVDNQGENMAKLVLKHSHSAMEWVFFQVHLDCFSLNTWHYLTIFSSLYAVTAQ